MTDFVSIVLAWLDLGATTAIAGGIVAAALVVPIGERGRRGLRWATGILAFTLVAELATDAWRMQHISGIRGFELVRDVLEMRWTDLWLARTVGLALLAVLLRGPRKLHAASAVVAVAWLAPRSLQGHAGAHEAAAAVADWIHLVAASAWLGGLLQFAVEDTASSEALRRLRTLATTAVLTLVASGVYGALFHLHSVHALLHSAYGQALILKIVLASPLFLLGATNHFRLSPRAMSGAPDAVAALRRSVKLELVLGVAVLAATAFLGFQAMPHA